MKNESYVAPGAARAGKSAYMAKALADFVLKGGVCSIVDGSGFVYRVAIPEPLRRAITERSRPPAP